MSRFSDRELAEIDRLIRLRRKLADAITEIDTQLAVVNRRTDRESYRVALRPDDRDADPMSYRTLMDDIVVKDVEMFRAEQMDAGSWWVACYLRDCEERICWNVSSSGRIKWVTTEFPAGVVYEHDLSRTAQDGT